MNARSIILGDIQRPYLILGFSPVLFGGLCSLCIGVLILGAWINAPRLSFGLAVVLGVAGSVVVRIKSVREPHFDSLWRRRMSFWGLNARSNRTLIAGIAVRHKGRRS